VSDWKVGDPVVVEVAQYYHRQGQPYEPKLKYGTVIKVARKYFTVEFVEQRESFSGIEWREHRSTDEYSIATGVQRPKNPDFTQYLDNAYSPEGWESEQFRRGVSRRIREDHKVHSDFLGTMNLRKWSDAHLVELLDLLERVKAEDEKTELDR